MRRQLLVLFLATSATCRTVDHVAPVSAASGDFRPDCEAVQALDFGQVRATALRGGVWMSEGLGSKPIADVQIAARPRADGAIRFVFSDVAGAFDLKHLPTGEYDVWTCLDGYDEARFQLLVSDAAPAHAVDIFLRPSEAIARFEVVPRD